MGRKQLRLPAAVKLHPTPSQSRPWIAVGVVTEDGEVVGTELDVDGVRSLVGVLQKWLRDAKRGRVGEAGIEMDVDGELVLVD